MPVKQEVTGDDKYLKALAFGNLIMAYIMVTFEKNEDRRKKMSSAFKEKSKLLVTVYPEELQKEVDKNTKIKESILIDNLEINQRKTFLIEMAFANPFAPYEIDLNKTNFRKALIYLANCLELEASVAERILKSKVEATKVHRNIEWGKIAIWSLGGLVVIAMGGYVAAPAIGTAIGSAAGLSGAAASAHGLAILGGGSLAAGGAGMAGGMWAVTGVSAVAGGTLFGGGQALLQIGANAAKVELIKLEVNYREMILGGQVEQKKAQQVIMKLMQEKNELKKQYEVEKLLNEKNSARIKNFDETIKAMEAAIKWMEEGRNDD